MCSVGIKLPHAGLISFLSLKVKVLPMASDGLRSPVRSLACSWWAGIGVGMLQEMTLGHLMLAAKHADSTSCPFGTDNNNKPNNDGFL